MYAVIKTGGKQYRVAADDKILIEKLEGAAGDQVNFTEVLMVSNGGTVDIGAPFLSGATVVGEIEKQARGPHIIIFKKRRRKHYRRRNGHRQDLTSVTITEILTGGAKPAAKAKAKPEVKAEAKAETKPAAAAEAPPAAAEAKPKKAPAKPRKPKTDKE
jgi:large subunit ribosomal protein L21